MSGIGEAASLLTLIKAARVLATSTCHAVAKFKNAPAELTALVAQVLALESELELYKYTADHGHDMPLAADIRNLLFDALTDARNGVSKLDGLCKDAKDMGSVFARLRWMRNDRKIADALAEVRVAREKLNSYMQILTWSVIHIPGSCATS